MQKKYLIYLKMVEDWKRCQQVFKKEKKYLISGPNGAGKTTLINILIRQYISLSGRLSINGINIKKIDIEQMRRECFSVMSQEQKFPSLSILEYINLSNGSNYSDKDIINILIKKNMSNIAMDIYCILEKGIKDINMLSGGEKQKIEFVKTILKRSKSIYI